MATKWKETTPGLLRQAGITPEDFGRVYRPACLYEMDKKDGIWLVISDTQKRPFVRRSLL